MIQELLGGGATGVLGGERKISINSGVFQSSPSISPSPSPSPSPSSSTATTPTSSSAADSQSLRCPRCDSANTKFCYYNNYNLTQPRHFCKTCRRYWTKGGALRNVPIGGGCRKNKSTSVVAASVGKASPGKLKTVSSELGKSGFINGFGLDHDPILWASPQSSHLLALLRSTQNPSPNPNSVNVKEEGFMFGSHMPAATGAFNTRTLGLDPLGQVPFWRNNQFQAQQQQEQRNGGFSLGEVIQNPEFYNQRLGSSANFSPVILGNVASNSTSSTCSTILESAPVAAGGDLGNFWNPSLSWSDLPTANGTAYP